MERPDHSKVLALPRDVLLNLWQKTFDVGGPHYAKTVRDMGTVDFASFKLEMLRDQGADAVDIAGRIGHFIVKEHPFADCNHRTGWAVVRYLLCQGGYEVDHIPLEEIRVKVKSIDQHDLSEEDFVEWLRGHARTFNWSRNSGSENNSAMIRSDSSFDATGVGIEKTIGSDSIKNLVHKSALEKRREPMDPEKALGIVKMQMERLRPLIDDLKEATRTASGRMDEAEETSVGFPSVFTLEPLIETLKQAMRNSAQASAIAADLLKFIAENQDALAAAYMARQKKGNGHPPTVANGMGTAEGPTCSFDICITPEGVKVLEECCNGVVNEKECQILFLRFKHGELSPEAYLAEIERLAGPVHDRDEKLAQIREILNPPGPDEEEEEPGQPDEDDDPEHLHTEGECEPCNLAAAIGQLAPIGQLVCPDLNEKWYNDALEEKITAWHYSELLMQEAVKRGRGNEIDLIDEVQKILRELKAAR